VQPNASKIPRHSRRLIGPASERKWSSHVTSPVSKLPFPNSLKHFTCPLPEQNPGGRKGGEVWADHDCGTRTKSSFSCCARVNSSSSSSVVRGWVEFVVHSLYYRRLARRRICCTVNLCHRGRVFRDHDHISQAEGKRVDWLSTFQVLLRIWEIRLQDGC
jgi:hypothetical protein